jgi:DNA repair protein SbcD/Mre11
MSETGSFCFVHAADLHLDTPFRGIHGIAPFVANELREASLDAFDAIVDLALSRRAAFLVIAGDVYDGPERGLRAQLRFASGLELLARSGIPSFVVHGNHDPVRSGWSAVSDWADGVTVFGSEEVELMPVFRDGRLLATVQGISYATADTTENLSLRFRRPPGEGFHVGLLHCNVGSDDSHESYSPCSVEDLRKSRLDYFALGHIHARHIVVEGTGPGELWAAYPGNSQARSPKPSERGPKGAVVVHVSDTQVQEIEFVACDRVRFEEVNCEIDDLADDLALEERLASLGEEYLERADGRSVILRARISGRGQLHADLARPGTLDGLLAELRREAGERRPFLWWDELIDESKPLLRREQIRLRSDFAADLLGVADEAGADPSHLLSIATALADGTPRSMRRHLEKLTNDKDRLRCLADEATTVALDAVLGASE